MSTLSQFGSGVKSIQTGFVATTGIAPAGATAEDARYLDITVSAISNVAKCVIFFDGVAYTSALGYASYNSSTVTMVIATKRVLNSTTIRLSSAFGNAAYFVGRWTLVEYI